MGKYIETARTLSLMHGVDFATALKITESVWNEARRSIEGLVDKGAWQRMSLDDKSAVCQVVIRKLLDKRRLLSAISENGGVIS